MLVLLLTAPLAFATPTPNLDIDGGRARWASAPEAVAEAG
jgi:hypothetical protein